MKFALLVVFAFLATRVSAFALAGGYERMLYYYAYVIDAQAHNGIPTVIAKDCRASLGLPTKLKKCNFNQFIQFINKQDKPVSITTEEFPDVDKTAQALAQAKLTGAYTPYRVFDGANDANTALSRVGDFVQNLNNDKGLVEAQLKGATTAVNRVAFLRGVANRNAGEDAVREAYPHITISTTTMQLYDGGEEYTVIDPAATKAANPGTNPQRVINDMNVADPGHMAMISAAQNAKAKINGCARAA